jgi:hypothetical protein
MSLPIIN